MVAAKVPILAGAVTRFGCAVGAGPGATHMIAGPLARFAMNGFRVGLFDADVDKLRAVLECIRHEPISMGLQG